MGSDVKWTPEPWRLSDEHPTIIKAGGDVMVASACGYTGSGYFPDDETAPHNAARIVACVNGCAGLNPEAVGDLLAAAKAYIDFYDNWGTMKQEDAAIGMLRAAIQKAETTNA